jgi:AraC-like DNA-binding protein
VIQTAAHILHGEPFVRDTVLETTMIDETAAYPMLKQYEAIMRDLQTFHIIQTQTESRWQQLRMDNKILWLCVVISVAFLLIALAYILFAQRRLQTEISHEILPQLENVQEAIQLSRRDEAFAERLRQVVDEHLTDPNLSVEYLGSMLQLSRTQLFRRVKTVAGKGPLDYIRERRLIRADEMLHTTDMTIQQVAIELCFTSPGYFSKCYKDYFGHLPSER